MKLLIQETVLRISSTDLTKGFDFIHHSILLDELRSFNIDQTPFFGYASSLPTDHTYK